MMVVRVALSVQKSSSLTGWASVSADAKTVIFLPEQKYHGLQPAPKASQSSHPQSPSKENFLIRRAFKARGGFAVLTYQYTRRTQMLCALIWGGILAVMMPS